MSDTSWMTQWMTHGGLADRVRSEAAPLRRLWGIINAPATPMSQEEIDARDAKDEAWAREWRDREAARKLAFDTVTDGEDGRSYLGAIDMDSIAVFATVEGVNIERYDSEYGDTDYDFTWDQLNALLAKVGKTVVDV